jgi:hypothetical protein
VRFKHTKSMRIGSDWTKIRRGVRKKDESIFGLNYCNLSRR